MKKIKQGDIFWADLNPVRGHEQAGCRPVLVLQNDLLNKNLNTIIIAPLTTNVSVKGFLTTYFFSAKQSKLNKDSIALLYQIRTIDKTRLQEKLSQLSEQQMREIKLQMALLF